MRHQWRDGYDDGHGAAQVPNTTGREPCSHGKQVGEQAIWQKSTTLGCISAYQAAPRTQNTYMVIHNLPPLRYHAGAGTGTGFGPRSRLSGRRRGGTPAMAWAQTRLGCCWGAEPNRDGLSQQGIVQGQIGLGGVKTALCSLAPHRSPTSNCREVEAVIRRKMGERASERPEGVRRGDVRRATLRTRVKNQQQPTRALFGGLVNPAH